MAAVQGGPPSSSTGRGTPQAAAGGSNDGTPTREPAPTTDLSMAALPAIGAFVALLLAGGLIFTLREFKRLSSENAGRPIPVRRRTAPTESLSLRRSIVPALAGGDKRHPQ